MIYEKKDGKAGDKRMDTCLMMLLGGILVLELIYVCIDFSSGFWSMKFVDVANVIAQLATAGAFYLGFHQYHRNKKVERQTVLVAECKAVIVKMVLAVRDFKVEDKTNFENIKACCIRLGNLASDFNILFESVDEGVHKAVVRMHWQDMYFNDFILVMSKLELGAAFEGTSYPGSYYLSSLNKARQKAKQDNVMEVFIKYFVFKEILSDDRFEGIRAKFDFSDLFQFVDFFFESEYTNDYMYGSLSRLDMRTRAPLIAAIQHACKLDVGVP